MQLVQKCSLLLGGMMALSSMAIGQEDSAGYKKRTLKGVEVDFLVGYYEQTGNNSAVTGGTGTEELTDFTPAVVVFLPFEKDSIQDNWVIDAGLDVYSSASSDKIDPNTISSESAGDTRTHANVSYRRKNLKKLGSWGANVSFSNEYDYTSVGGGLSYTLTSKDKNRELNLKGNAFFDTWQTIYPVELRGTADLPGSNGKNRNSFSGTISYSWTVSKRMQAAVISDVVAQNGLLSTPYHRVYFSDTTTLLVEKLPENRLKLPIGIRANYFIGSALVVRTYYRYYWDDWGLTAHTASIELPVKISPFFSLAPFYRYYRQSAVDYFAPIHEHVATDQFYSSDFDLSTFDSHYFGMNMRISPVNGLARFGKSKLHALEFRYGRYQRSNGLDANSFALHLKFTGL